MLSIITPVYNCERFIEICIKNVIEQDCSDVEHIIVDGGSSDGTVEIIKRYADQYPHIRWISERDRGQSDAMNKGIAMARGEVLGTLNADDFYEPNVLNRVLEHFKIIPEPGLLVGNCNIWSSQEQIRFVNKPSKLKFTDLLLGPEVNPFPLNPSAYFYHKSLHNQIGFYDLDEHYTLDFDFLLRAVQVANVVYVDEIWGNHLQIEGTKTFHDIQSGQNSARIENLIKKYRKNLPWHQYYWNTLNYSFYKAIAWNRLKYFINDPRNISRTMHKKIAHALTNGLQ